jgi:hypothetical protein
MILHILECDTDGCETTSATPMELEWNAIAYAVEDGWSVEHKPGGGHIIHCPEHYPRVLAEVVELTPSCVTELVQQIGDIEENDG